MKYDKSQWTKLMHWMDLYHEDDNLSDCQLMERGFRHAIEVLEAEASDDVPLSRDALCWAARILRDYADKEVEG